MEVSQTKPLLVKFAEDQEKHMKGESIQVQLQYLTLKEIKRKQNNNRSNYHLREVKDTIFIYF